MAKKIAISLHKGGVGKTCTAVSVGTFLAKKGYSVLAIDFDAQSNLSMGCGVDVEAVDRSLADLFHERCLIEETVVNRYTNFDIIPAVPELEFILESETIMSRRRKEYIIKAQLPRIEQRYDFVVMDTPPGGSGGVLTKSALAIADYVIAPLRPEAYGVRGLDRAIRAVTRLKQECINYGIEFLGVVFTFYRDTKDAQHHVAIVKEALQEEVFRTRIRDNVALAESATAGVPITFFKRKRSCNDYAYADYDALTDEILARIQRRREG